MEGFTVRPMSVDDAALIGERSSACTSALLGFAKHSAEDVANYLRDPGFPPETDGWVVLDRRGEFAGSATAAVNSDGSRVNLEVLSEVPEVAGWLLDRGLERARQAGPGEVVVSVGVIQQDEFLAKIVADRGFTVGTSVHRMRITFDGPVERPPVPPGAVVRRGAFDDTTRRAAHAVLEEAFSSQPGADPRPYDEWAASRESRSTFDWSRLTTVELDGRSGTILHVDTSNPTPALRLYTSAGMHPDLTSTIWRRTVRTRG
ncbi:GNAT family N-acetyltransferase [Kribbella turkmenica]|uniref:GNAT family N-acetyltransferase n=1 Tax=Kribbella turkmenica TaxID=2530375 RepID=A0A4R4WVY7_9ACTN|nr:GNAT family N-acetyltransferase [Kribbella turkmenica]TDD21860.1 GNAT family N-acetyltransferase [Kribbella turkmenica]